MRKFTTIYLVVLTMLFSGCGNSQNYVFTNSGTSGGPIAGIPTQLAFVQTPAQTTNTDFTIPPIVEIRDAFGNRVPGATNTITVALVEPGTAVLNGTPTRDAVDGQAVFPGLSVSEPGTYTMTCSAEGLTGATSAAFTVDSSEGQDLALYSLATPRGSSGMAVTQLIQLDTETGEYLGTLGVMHAGDHLSAWGDLQALPDGTVYALAFNDDTASSHLVEVNLSDPSNSNDLGQITGGASFLYSLAYDANNQILYGVCDRMSDGEDVLCTINPSTLVATILPNLLGVDPGQGLGLAYDNSTNTLYVTDSGDFRSVDTTTGASTLIGTNTLDPIDGSIGAKGLRGLDFNPSNNILVGLSRGGGVRTNSASAVGTINPTNGEATLIGLSPECSGLTFCLSPAVPQAGPARQTGYTVESIPQTFENITGGTELVLENDDSESVPLGFTFNFNGTDYSQVVVDSNGYVSFTSTTSVPTPKLLPTNLLENDSLMLWWVDLNPESNPATSGVFVNTLGDAPNRRFVVQYAGIRHDYPPAPNGINAEIILYETTNVIEFHYSDVEFGDEQFDLGRSAIVGIQTDASHADIWSAFQPVLTETTAIRFTPPAP